MSDKEEYLQLFFDESRENLQILNQKVMELEQFPDKPRDIIDSMFRAAHSLKGMAATMGYEKLTKLAHKIESLMDQVRNKKISVNSRLVDLLFEGIDYISEIINDLKRNDNDNVIIVDYLLSVSDYLNGKEIEKDLASNNDQQSIGIELTEEEMAAIKDDISQTDNVYRIKVAIDKDSLFKDIRGYMVLKKASELGYVLKSNPSKEKLEKEDVSTEIICLVLISKLASKDIKKEIEDIIDITNTKIDNIKIDHVESKSGANKSNNTSVNKLQVAPTVRVDINKLDQLMNMVGELMINKTRLDSLNIHNDIYNDIISQLDRVTMDLHHIVMQIRMVPIAGMFNRFPRMVRDLSKQMNKEINFIIEGENTELDRSIIDELSDPMVHLLRNAIDHGIESQSIRQKKGKDRVGSILLNAYQKGSEIIIEIEDDGQGINPEKLVETAIKKEIITEQEAEEMGLKEKLHLVFEPGFSTIKEISDISGRGVGMDVVKKAVEGLDGKISIETEIGVGTRFTISLPLTLAITKALMVKINNETFAIPLSAINETLLIEVSEVKQVKGQDVIIVRDRTLPLVDSRESLNLNVAYGLYKEQDKISVVVINSDDKQIGLVVDGLLNQQEIVVKTLSDYFKNVKNISGATIIGDGDVALILDVRNIA